MLHEKYLCFLIDWAAMTIFGDSEKWKNKDLVEDLLVERMMAGNLLLCLGSGVSYFADLPEWKKLIGDVAKKKDGNYTLDPSLDPYVQADLIRSNLFGATQPKRQEFLKEIHERLFHSIDEPTLIRKLDQNPGMKAIQMLASGSIRGGTRYIVTFNYDDILEILLRNLGVVTQSTDNHQFLLNNADVSVFHPHGLLRLSDATKEMNRFVVISQTDAKDAVTKSWRQTITFLLSKHFPVFIGLGGRDIRVLDLLDEVQEQSHLANKTRAGFLGVRLSDKADPSNSIWEEKGIKCICFDDMPAEWPTYVEAICRKAAAIREKDANFMN